eukprot:767450-Hanusia_phi.AAC.1
MKTPLFSILGFGSAKLPYPLRSSPSHWLQDPVRSDSLYDQATTPCIPMFYPPLLLVLYAEPRTCSGCELWVKL